MTWLHCQVPSSHSSSTTHVQDAMNGRADLSCHRRRMGTGGVQPGPIFLHAPFVADAVVRTSHDTLQDATCGPQPVVSHPISSSTSWMFVLSPSRLPCTQSVWRGSTRIWLCLVSAHFFQTRSELTVPSIPAFKLTACTSSFLPSKLEGQDSHLCDSENKHPDSYCK
jgi:hypothetical protein